MVKGQIIFEQGDREHESSAMMAREVRAGIKASIPRIPSKYFYDDRGSRLFDAITRLPEYYQTRTETRLLESVARDIVTAVHPRELVELGSGVGEKTKLLLDSMAALELLQRCTILDINETFLLESAQMLLTLYPDLTVRALVGDFMRDLDMLGRNADRLVIFLGGTIGNIRPANMQAFLLRIRATLGTGSGVLIGLDLVKETARLEAAYNDQDGVTAEFNLNILKVLNRHLDADFDVAEFEHVAFYDPHKARIEMRVRAKRKMRVSLPGAELQLDLARGDELLTEISHKYTRDSFTQLLASTGLETERWYCDSNDLFALALLKPKPLE